MTSATIRGPVLLTQNPDVLGSLQMLFVKMTLPEGSLRNTELFKGQKATLPRIMWKLAQIHSLESFLITLPLVFTSYVFIQNTKMQLFFLYFYS